MKLYLIIGCDTKKFNQYDVVQLVTIINNAYLVEKINSDEREWIISYNLYPFINHHLSGFHIYNNKYQKLIPDIYYINKNTNDIKILNDVNDNPDYIPINSL